MLKQVIYLRDGLRAGFMIEDKVYDADTGKLVEGYEAIKDLSWNELSDAVLSEAGKKSIRCTLQAEPLEEKEEKSIDIFAIYQVKKDLREYCFTSYSALERMGMKVERSNYDFIYQGLLEPKVTLEDIYARFNLSIPKDYKGHSLSVSDVVVIDKNNVKKAYYVDSFGFRELSKF